MAIVAVAHSGCKKEESVVVQGTVREGYQNGSISNARVELEYNEISGASFSTGFKEIGVTTTDASGNFSFEFERVKAVNYQLTTTREGFETARQMIGGDEWTVAQTNRVELDIFETAELNVRFINAAPASPDDQLLFQLKPHSEGCISCCTSQIIAHTSVDTSFTCKVYANQVIGYDYTVISGSDAQSISGDIDITPGSGNTIEISF